MKIALGMVWDREGHRMEVTKMYKNGKCQITETWVSEDTWKDCKHVANCMIATDNRGEQYAYDTKYEEQANPGHDGEDEYSWWARHYACGTINAQEFAEEETNNKEERDMKAQEMNFAIGTTKYNRTVNGYLYKRSENDEKWIRIGKAEWEQAFDEYLQTSTDVASVDEWGNEETEAKKTREEKAKKSDKQAEDKVNGKKASKPRKSKDVAFEGKGFAGGITLTAKQVDFLKSLQGISFWDDGINSHLWCDCIAQDTGWNPMSVGAMISTLREKHLVAVGQERVNGKKCKFMAFTETGKEVATQLGLN